MIKVLNYKNKNNISKLIQFLEIRRNEKKQDNKIVNRILKAIKKDKVKALLKYEKKFSKNIEIRLSKNRINNSIKKLDPKIKKAIDYA